MQSIFSFFILLGFVFSLFYTNCSKTNSQYLEPAVSMSLEDRLASQPSGMIGVIVKVKALSATGKQKAVSLENSKSRVLDLVKVLEGIILVHLNLLLLMNFGEPR